MVNNIVTIGQKLIGSGERPYFIAELSGNHNGSLDRALALVEAAARAGADAVKLQTYTADTMTLDCSKPEFIVQDPNSPWHGRTLYELYSEAHTPWAWHEPIFDRVRKLGMTPLSTPFDSTAVDFLESLGLEWYKIASFELTDHLLLRYVARTGKPMILSTGMATLEEIAEAVNIVRTFGCPEVILLKCTSAYPANPKDINLLSIPDMSERFDCIVGLSDHTMGVGTSIASIVLGAQIIEKHLTLARIEGGVDSSFSLEPQEFRNLVNEGTNAWLSMGSISYGTGSSEDGSRQFRRSLYAAKSILAGEELTADNIRCIRPSFGLAPDQFERLIGKRAKVNIDRGSPLRWDLID